MLTKPKKLYAEITLSLEKPQSDFRSKAPNIKKAATNSSLKVE